MSDLKFRRTPSSVYEVVLDGDVIGSVYPTGTKMRPWIAMDAYRVDLGGFHGRRSTAAAAVLAAHEAAAAADEPYLDGPQDVTITFRFTMDPTEAVDGPPPTAAQFADAVNALAGVMLVQTEDGLYTLGSEDAGGGMDDNRYLASIEFPTEPTTVSAIQIKDHRS